MILINQCVTDLSDVSADLNPTPYNKVYSTHRRVICTLLAKSSFAGIIIYIINFINEHSLSKGCTTINHDILHHYMTSQIRCEK